MSGNNGFTPYPENPRPDNPRPGNPGAGDPDIDGGTGNPIPHLDGNAAAGALWEIFRFDIIAAIGRCKHCGAVSEVARATVYTDAPGIVVRCGSCEGVLLRLVETPTRYWLDLSGLSYLEIDREG